MTVLDDLKNIGVKDGDLMLVHSACSKVKADAYEVFSVLRESIGKDGTLVLPTFSFSHKWGAPEMGILSRICQSLSESERIPHPVHSFSILGKLAKELGEIKNKSSYGADSLFGKLM